MLAKVSRIAQIIPALVILSVLLFAGGTPADAAGDPLAAVRFALDADPHFGVANTATSVGGISINATMNENDVLDGDEDLVDAIQIDVVTWAGGIPAANPLVEYGYTLSYPTPFTTISSQTPKLIGVNPGSSISIVGDTVPDMDGSFVSHVIDGGPTPGSSESGDGVLDSLIFETQPGVATGVFPIFLSSAFHAGSDGVQRPPTTIDVGIYIGINTTSSGDQGAVILSLDNSFPTEVAAGATNDLTTDFVADIIGEPFSHDMDLTATISMPAECTLDGAGPGGDYVFGETLPNWPPNTFAPHQEVHAIRCVSPGPQVIGVEACAKLLAVPSGSECMSMDVVFEVVAAADLDTDGDGVFDEDEFNCGSDLLNPLERPERVDVAFAGVSDDGDVPIDEALPGGAGAFDCDGDGYSGDAEDHVYSYIGQLDGDQKTCQEYDTNFTVVDPNQTAATPSLRWPPDFNSATFPLNSFNKITILDLTSFLAPVKYFGTNVGTNPGDVRWDLSPGAGIFPTGINIQDLTAMIAGSSGAPAMLGGAKALGGPVCPYGP